MDYVDSMINEALHRVSAKTRSDTVEQIVRELGWALIAEGQLFLQANSDEYDVDLLFDTYGYPRQEEPRSWVRRIVVGLQGRVADAQMEGIRDRALGRLEKKIEREARQAPGSAW